MAETGNKPLEEPIAAPATPEKAARISRLKNALLSATMGLTGIGLLAGVHQLRHEHQGVQRRGKELDQRDAELDQREKELRDREQAESRMIDDITKLQKEQSAVQQQIQQRAEELVRKEKAWNERLENEAKKAEEERAESARRLEAPYQIGNLLKETLANHNHIVFGDTDHTAEEIGLFIASHMKAMKEAGVQAIFLELDRDDKHGAYTGVQGKFSHHVIETYEYLHAMAVEHKIQIFLMDKPVTSEAGIRGSKLYFEHMKLKKELGWDHERTREAKAKLTGEDWDAFLAERRKINQDWADYIESTMKKNNFTKAISECGTYHVNNPIEGEDDFDEQLAKKDIIGSCTRIDLMAIGREDRANFIKMTKKHATPDYMIIVPQLSTKFKEHLSYEAFKYLVDSDQWRTIATKPDIIQYLEDMSPASFIQMMQTKDFAHVELYKKFHPDAVNAIKAEGMEKEALEFSETKIAQINKILPQLALSHMTNVIPSAHSEEMLTSDLEKSLRSARQAYLKDDLATMIDIASKLTESIYTTPEKFQFKTKIIEPLPPDDPFAALQGRSFSIHMPLYADDLVTSLQVESFKRQGNMTAAKLVEEIASYNDWTSWAFGVLGSADGLSEPQQKLYDLDKIRWQTFRKARQALFDDKPEEARSLLESYVKQGETLQKLAKETPKPENEEEYSYDVRVSKKGAREAEFDALLDKYIREKEMKKGGKER